MKRFIFWRTDQWASGNALQCDRLTASLTTRLRSRTRQPRPAHPLVSSSKTKPCQFSSVISLCRPRVLRLLWSTCSLLCIGPKLQPYLVRTADRCHQSDSAAPSNVSAERCHRPWWRLSIPPLNRQLTYLHNRQTQSIPAQQWQWHTGRFSRDGCRYILVVVLDCMAQSAPENWPVYHNYKHACRAGR